MFGQPWLSSVDRTDPSSGIACQRIEGAGATAKEIYYIGKALQWLSRLP